MVCVCGYLGLKPVPCARRIHPLPVSILILQALDVREQLSEVGFSRWVDLVYKTKWYMQKGVVSTGGRGLALSGPWLEGLRQGHRGVTEHWAADAGVDITCGLCSVLGQRWICLGRMVAGGSVILSTHKSLMERRDSRKRLRKLFNQPALPSWSSNREKVPTGYVDL